MTSGEQVKTGRRVGISPITDNAYLVTKWREHGDGKIVAIEKEPIEDRLFVPVKSEYWRWFEKGEKDIELRGVNDQFNRSTVREGRWAELRRGYSTGDSLWGEIAGVWTFNSVESVADRIDHTRIVPTAAGDRDGFEESARELLDGYDKYIAFEVEVIESA